VSYTTALVYEDGELHVVVLKAGLEPAITDWLVEPERLFEAMSDASMVADSLSALEARRVATR
jgi:hypothetical protein